MAIDNIIPVSPAVRVGNTVYFGGIPPIDPENRLLCKNDLQGQVRVCVEKIATYLKKTSMGLENLVFVTIYLTDIKLFQQLNQIYSQLMPEPYPARKVIQTPLALEGMLVEISGIASTEKKEILKL